MSLFDLMIYDCDGTLIDSLAGIAQAANLALDDVGLPAGRSNAEVAQIVGLSLDLAMSVLIGEQSPAVRDKVVMRYRHHYRRLADQGLFDNPLFPGVRPVLERFQAAGILQAVATGKSRAGLDRNLADHDLGGFFVALKTADSSPSKPHPGMVLEILEQTGADPKRTLVVGDTDFDLLMGKSAGVRTCAVTFGCHDRDRLTRAEPDYWVEGWAGLPEVVGLNASG